MSIPDRSAVFLGCHPGPGAHSREGGNRDRRATNDLHSPKPERIESRDPHNPTANPRPALAVPQHRQLANSESLPTKSVDRSLEH